MEKNKYPYHEAADLLPLTEEAVAALAADIKKNGLLCPVELLDGKVIDGRCRQLACKRAGVECDYVTVEPKDPIAYVLSLNLHRRHLSTSQRAMVAARASKMYADEAKERQRRKPKSVMAKWPEQNGTARDEVGAAAGVGGRTVGRALLVLKHGDEELVKAVDAGEITVAAAVKQLPDQSEPPTKKKKRPKTVSERALAVYDAIDSGEVLAKASLRFGFASKVTAGRAAKVVRSDDKDLIDAMDKEVLTVNAAYDLLPKPKEERLEAIGAAELKLAEKNGKHKSFSYADRKPEDLVIGLLGRTVTDWIGYGRNLRINKKTFPAKSDKLESTLRMCKSVRLAVNTYLDAIESELERCLQKTAEQKIT